MGQLVILTEEPSAAEFLRGLIPRLYPNWQERVDWLVIPHEGKQALEQSIPRKLRGWNTPEARFLILRDSDSADCRDAKSSVLERIPVQRYAVTLVRIAVRELESWYLGDLPSVERAFGVQNIALLQHKAKFRDPDLIDRPSDELRRLVPSYQKVGGSRQIGRYLSVGQNRSRSFSAFIDAIHRLADRGN